MKRISFAAVLALLLAACGSSASSAGNTKTTTPPRTTLPPSTTEAPTTTLAGQPTVVQTAESAKLAQVWACNYEDAIIASVIGGPSPDLFSQVGYDTVEVAGLSYQAATNSTTPANSTSKKLYKDAQAQETFASSMTNVNWSEPATFLSGSAPNAVMKDCDAIANSKS